jgi:hypothetical protein
VENAQAPFATRIADRHAEWVRLRFPGSAEASMRNQSWQKNSCRCVRFPEVHAQLGRDGLSHAAVLELVFATETGQQRDRRCHRRHFDLPIGRSRINT